MSGFRDYGALAPVEARGRAARPLLVGVVLLLAAALGQTTAAPWAPSGLPRLDVVLALALAWCFRRGRGEGVLLALAGGLLLDLSSAGPFGLHTLALGLALLLVEGAGETLTGSWPRRLLASVLTGALVELVALGVLVLRGWGLPTPGGLARAALPTIGADLILVLVLYVLVGWLLRAAHLPRRGEAN